MGLRIASNLAAERVQANLRKVTNKSDKALERLSSGKRIIQAADDSAGLAIAKSIEAQVRALNRQVEMPNDAISLIQTAEGSLNETSNILSRLKELAVQSASDTLEIKKEKC